MRHAFMAVGLLAILLGLVPPGAAQGFLTAENRLGQTVRVILGDSTALADSAQIDFDIRAVRADSLRARFMQDSLERGRRVVVEYIGLVPAFGSRDVVDADTTGGWRELVPIPSQPDDSLRTDDYVYELPFATPGTQWVRVRFRTTMIDTANFQTTGIGDHTAVTGTLVADPE